MFAQAVSLLRAAGVASPETDARLLLCHALGISREALAADPARPLAAAERRVYAALIARRRDREPVSRILGRREFFGLDFEIGPATLDPRPDSETLVEAALALARHGAWRDREPHILDIGTGSGCLLLTLLQAWPQATGVGVDISADALRVARKNAAALALSARAEWLQSDFLVDMAGRFDLVVSNPPYIPTSHIPALDPEVSRYDPQLALDGGHDGLSAYRSIVPALPAVLAEGGIALLEIDPALEAPVRGLLASAGLDVRAVHPDLTGSARVIETSRR